MTSTSGVKSLWYQAQQGFNDQLCDDAVVERFARLIAEDCAKLIDAGDGHMCSMAEHVWCNACRDAIRNHYRIEK
jgi:hypothetical protein